MTATSPWHLPLIAVGVGFHLAIAWALFWRYFQARERSLLTWGVAWLVLGVHVLGMFLTRMGLEEAAPFLRDMGLAGGALALFTGQVEREGRAFRPLTIVAGAAAVIVGGAVVAGIFLGSPVTTVATTVVILCLGGAAYLAAPIGAGARDVPRWLLFAGYITAVCHALAYLIPLPLVWSIRAEIFTQALFSLFFSAAVTWQTWEPERAFRLFPSKLEDAKDTVQLRASRAPGFQGREWAGGSARRCPRTTSGTGGSASSTGRDGRGRRSAGSSGSGSSR